MFVAYCWGAAGSSWLAWALNSHAHILCLHAPKFPRFSGKKRGDALAIIHAFYSMPALGGEYKAVGFTHGVRREWHSEFVTKYGDRFRGFILTRHPIKRIHSLTALHVKAKRKFSIDLRDRFTEIKRYAQLIAASKRIDLPKDRAALAFYHACAAANRIVSEVGTGLPIYRLEDLVGSVEKFQELLSFVSNGALNMGAEDVQALQATVIHKHAPKPLTVLEIYDEWSVAQKEAFQHMVTPRALTAYESLGYEFPESARQLR